MAVEQVGWVMVPTTGAVGVDGCGLITILADAEEIQRARLERWQQENYPEPIIRMGMVMAAAAIRAHRVAMIAEGCL